ncbi:hypothetical protein G7076_00530 [Sphingomonas sp. HDW15A]|uniref:hypothetical protein n=1 Tax=Sphingomonas sp. HDW15A TaxID=2714942 RepID=UPI00140DC172|nr:hypothetical protein [Sphingomonas sp. HDW15A]QIK95174.1 hypothetical protein G7076_00530 [Sphingomonas sp. HDW15A]
MSGRHSFETSAERARAAAAAIAVNLFVGIAFVTGLALREDDRRENILETYDVALPPPPRPLTERRKVEHKVRQEEGVEGKKAEPSPVVALPSPLPRPTPVIAAPTPGTGSNPSTGNADSGTGPGAGGSGLERVEVEPASVPAGPARCSWQDG